MRVLITAGGTEEPIDGVRRLTNVSSGATGGVLARAFAASGAEVVLLHAERAAVGDGPFERVAFVTFADLERELERLLGGGRFDAILHLAAVSDYGVAAVEVDGRPWPQNGGGKFASGRDVVIRLRPHPKLIDSLKEWASDPALTVVGFKLTDDPDPERRRAQVEALLGRGGADLVVHNDLSEITAERHRATIYDRRGPLATVETKAELADALLRLVTHGATP